MTDREHAMDYLRGKALPMPQPVNRARTVVIALAYIGVTALYAVGLYWLYCLDK